MFTVGYSRIRVKGRGEGEDMRHNGNRLYQGVNVESVTTSINIICNTDNRKVKRAIMIRLHHARIVNTQYKRVKQ